MSTFALLELNHFPSVSVSVLRKTSQVTLLRAKTYISFKFNLIKIKNKINKKLKIRKLIPPLSYEIKTCISNLARRARLWNNPPPGTCKIK